MPRLAHHVFFTLSDPTPARIDDLVAACKKYLDDHEGVVDFSVGVRVQDLARPVNDTEYHVSLHVIFADRAAHDRYQTAPRHIDFINEQKPHWKGVRVCDSVLEA